MQNDATYSRKSRFPLSSWSQSRKRLSASLTGVNFSNVRRTNFSYKHRFSSFYYLHVTRNKLPKWRSYKKFARLTLMKLTPGFIELHVIAFSKKLRWLAQTKVITLKTQLHAVNACWKRLSQLSLKLRCDTSFQHAFTARGYVFKVITLVWTNQRNYFENATAYSRRTLKTRIAMQGKSFLKFLDI